MKQIPLLTALLVLIGLATSTMTPTFPHSKVAAAQVAPVTFHEQNIDGTSVTWILVNTSDPRVHIRPVVANQRFGTAAPLATLAASDHAIAAINGTYFNDPGNLWPQGTLEVDGTWQHGDKGTIFAYAPGGKMVIARAYPSLFMKIGNRQAWPWGINSWHHTPTEIAVLTPMFGHTTGISNGTSVVVVNQKVSKIHSGNTSIPRNGYIIEWGKSTYNQSFLANSVQVGAAVTFQVSLDNYDHQTIAFPSPTEAISAGPMLVDLGHINLDPAIEGFRDPKLIDSNTTRTMIGYTKNHELVMALLATATLPQEAKIAKQMGLQEAMNMDGAASSGMYYRGKYIVRPSRNLATALTVTVQ